MKHPGPLGGYTRAHKGRENLGSSCAARSISLPSAQMYEIFLLENLNAEDTEPLFDRTLS